MLDASVLASDPGMTKDRVRRLKRYYSKNVWDESRSSRGGSDIVCTFGNTGTDGSCRREGCSFYPAQLSYVGDSFDLETGGNPLRIVVSGYEYRDNDHTLGYREQRGRVSVDERGKMINGLFKGTVTNHLNQHMKGTLLVLRAVLGAGDHDSVEVDRLLCCRKMDGDVRRGGMHRNCAPHYFRALEILQPTLVVLQGKATSFRGMADECYGRGNYQWDLKLPRIDPAVRVFVSDRLKFVTCEFRHPSRGGLGVYKSAQFTSSIQRSLSG
jgi:hypothetical protein